MKIIDIKHIGTNETRTDGRYPLRIGSEAKFCSNPCIGECMYLVYIKDNQGNYKGGRLRTSMVQNIERKEHQIVVSTLNSIYYFDTDKE